MEANSLIDVLNCARLQRYSRYVWETQNKLLIGIPVTPDADINTIVGSVFENLFEGADLVLLVLQQKLPRTKIRSYLMKIISFDGVAAILRSWRSPFGENVMHLAVAHYDLDFVKLLAAKCGEDLLTMASKTTSPLPLCSLYQNKMIKHYNQIERTIDYYISKVPCGLSWMRSGVFQQLSSYDVRHIRPTKFINALFDRPVLVADMTEHEKSAAKSFGIRHGYLLSWLDILQTKFSTIFLLSEPTKSECNIHIIPDRCGTSWEPKKIQNTLDMFEEIKSMKQLTVADRGLMVALADMLFHAINRHDTFVQPYIGILWTLNDCGALPKTLEDTLKAKHGEIDPFLENLLREPTISVENIQQFEFHKHDLPAIYTELICMYLKSWFSGPVFRSTEISSVEFPLLDLPFDILTVISSTLCYRDFVALSLTNKQLVTLTKRSSIWRAKFEQYFPNETARKEYSQTSFNRRYKNKFNVTEIAGSGALFSTEYSVPLYCDMYSVELNKNDIIYTSKHHQRITLLDIDTKQHVSVEHFGPAVARVHEDRVIVMTKKNVQVRTKSNLEVLSEFPRKEPGDKLPSFALSNSWLVSSDCLYDWNTGQILDSHEYQHGILLRDQMCYGINESDILIRDLRSSTRSQQKVSNSKVNKFSSINVFDGKIYTAGESIDIFDTRYLQQQLSTVVSRNIGPCDRKDYYTIDLVNMNVWGSQVSWDLIDNKWERAYVCPHFNICDKVCNGKYLAVLFIGVLKLYELSGSTPFPYGDLKLNRFRI